MPFIETVIDFLVNRPLVLMGLMALPLILIAWFWQAHPTRRLFWIFCIPAIISLTIIQVPQVAWYLLVLNLLLAGIAIVDLFSVPGAEQFRAQRRMVTIASLGKRHHCELTISNASNHGCQVEIRDDVPDGFVAEPDHFQYSFQPTSRAAFEYELTCQQRGKFRMECIYLRVASRWGLWHGYHRLQSATQIHVYPDMKQITEYDLLARTNRLNLMGVRRSRKIGSDNEFERLRDYTQDDNYRFIDWRATARRRKLTVRDFQANQSQRVIFLVDCGRMMMGQSGEYNMLDHALNAMLMLGYVALRKGDSVGLICFSDSIHNYTPAHSGVKHINRLLHASFDQHPRFVESRYDRAFLYLRNNCLKRSLVVLITNIIDEINSHQVQQYLGNLVHQHLPLGVLLRDHQMFDSIDHVHQQPGQIYNAAAAARIAGWRFQVIRDLQHQGVLSLDVFPEQLTAQLINQYLEIKAKHLL